MQDEETGFNVKFRGQILAWLFWSCLYPGPGLQVLKGIFLAEKTDFVIVIHTNIAVLHWNAIYIYNFHISCRACYISQSFGSTLHTCPELNWTMQRFCLSPRDRFQNFFCSGQSKSIFFSFFLFLALKNMSCWKIRYHFQVNRQCILYVKCWNHNPTFPYFPLHFQPKPLAERKSTWTALNPTLFLIEFTIQQINKAMQL